MEEPTLDKVAREEIFEEIPNLSLENKKEQTMSKWRAGRWEHPRLRSEDCVCKGPEAGKNLILFEELKEAIVAGKQEERGENT